LKTIAAIFAHPDDSEIWAGGTLAKHIDLGFQVNSYTFYQLTPIRRIECQNAASIIGSNCFFCPTNPYSQPDLSLFYQSLVTIPDIILTHWEYDTHIEHQNIFRLCVGLIHIIAREKRKDISLLMSSTYNMLGRNLIFTPEIIFDVSKEYKTKLKSISVYKSQKPQNILEDMKNQNKIFGNWIKKGFGEGFVEYPLFGRKRSLNRISLDEFVTF
jgi:LmbE family N-acetylglucosaminyl deacetylase